MSKKAAEPAFRGRVVSVFGPFNAYALIEVSATTAQELFGADLSEQRGFGVIDAVDRELADLRERSPGLADSAIAAAIRVLAYEIENPYNSLTSKAAGTKELREGSDRLRELSPPEEKRGELHGIKSGRALRLAAGGPGT